MRTTVVVLLVSQALLLCINTLAAPVDSHKDSKRRIQYGYGSPLSDYDGLPGTNYGGMMVGTPQGYLGSQSYPTSLIYPGSMVHPGIMGLVAAQDYPGTIGFPLTQGYGISGGSYNGYPQMSGLIQPRVSMMYREKDDRLDKSNH